MLDVIPSTTNNWFMTSSLLTFDNYTIIVITHLAKMCITGSAKFPSTNVSELDKQVTNLQLPCALETVLFTRRHLLHLDSINSISARLQLMMSVNIQIPRESFSKHSCLLYENNN